MKPKPKRVKMREQPSYLRVTNFKEVPYGYSKQEAIKEASRCLCCRRPKCQERCPVGIEIPRFITAIKKGNFLEAIKIIKEKNSLPAICGRVCPQEVQCERVCILNKISSPVAIGNLERFCADWEKKEGVEVLVPKMKPTHKKVGIIGAGPAGLTCAAELAIRGHKVTIFEALQVGGGVLMYGIPEFRLPKEIVIREIEYVKRLGVELITSYVVGKTKTVDELLEEFDALFVGTGAGLPWFMNIPGEESNGVYSANEYLVRANLMKAYMFPEYDTPIMRGKIVAVIGGGNVAMDAARTAIRLGTDKVYVIYRRTKKELPARIEEIRHAEEEGVNFMFLATPVKYYSNEKGQVKEVECIKMKLGEKDASGRRKPFPILGSNFKLKVDTVIVAIGNSPNPLIPTTTPGLKIGKNGGIIVDAGTGKTSKQRVWAGGDIVRGAATVISAMGDGKVSALDIDKYLRTL